MKNYLLMMPNLDRPSMEGLSEWEITIRLSKEQHHYIQKLKDIGVICSSQHVHFENPRKRFVTMKMAVSFAEQVAILLNRHNLGNMICLTDLYDAEESVEDNL